MDPTNYDCYINRASIYIKLNKFNEAICDLNEVIKFESNNQNAYLRRAECYEHINNFNSSYKDYEKALEIGKKMEKNN